MRISEDKKGIIQLRKLHITVSEDLFREIRDHELLRDIDNLFAEMITERIEAIKRGEQHDKPY